MIDTSLTTVAKDAVEQAKDVAQETWSGVAQALRSDKKPKHRVRTWLFVLVGALGVGAAAWFVRRRSAQRERDFAPDSFGAAVMEERMASMSGRAPLATPGA
jgi:hypothetical protein